MSRHDGGHSTDGRAAGDRPAHPLKWVAIAAIAAAFLAVPSIAGIPGRLVAGCAGWIALAVVLEALSVLGFVLVFKLVFGARMSCRQACGSSLRALGASSLLPGGTIVGPMMGARSGPGGGASLTRLTRSTIAFAILTTLPGVIVLGVLGLVLSFGLLTGPHDAARTLPAAGVALALVAGVSLKGRSRSRHSARWDTTKGRSRTAKLVVAALRALPEGVSEARSVLAARNWKLVGALAYYAFDNAVLWAAFHAYARPPSATVIVLGYLVGSLGSAVPVPAGLGAVEGGLIGALVLYGAPAGPAVGAVLLYRGVSLLLPVTVGAGAWALLGAAKLRPKARRSSPTFRGGAMHHRPRVKPIPASAK